MYMLHFVYPFIHLWTLGLLPPLWQLWLLWTWMCKYLFKTLLSLLLGIYPEVEFLDNMVILFLIYWGTALLFSIVAAPFCIPTNNAQGFQFLQMFAILNVLISFDIGYPNFCKYLLSFFSLCWLFAVQLFETK